jgi:hypothetical protein
MVLLLAGRRSIAIGGRPRRRNIHRATGQTSAAGIGFIRRGDRPGPSGTFPEGWSYWAAGSRSPAAWPRSSRARCMAPRRCRWTDTALGRAGSRRCRGRACHARTHGWIARSRQVDARSVPLVIARSAATKQTSQASRLLRDARNDMEAWPPLSLRGARRRSNLPGHRGCFATLAMTWMGGSQCHRCAVGQPEAIMF